MAQVTEQDARKVAEAARETEWSNPSFVKELFLGRLRLDLIDPPPTPDPEEQARAAVFLRDIEKWTLRRPRYYQWKQWGMAGYRELRNRGVTVREA